MRNNLYFISGMLFLITCFLSCATGTKDDKKESKSQEIKQESASVRPVHWGYEGDEAPEKWGALSPAYALCAQGMHQSPINIETSAVAKGVKWKFDYKNTTLDIAFNEHVEEILDNGHTIQVTVEEGSTFTFEGKAYSLKQFHFHAPSEHTVDGMHAPVEMHLVHQSEDGSSGGRRDPV